MAKMFRERNANLETHGLTPFQRKNQKLCSDDKEIPVIGFERGNKGAKKSMG